MPTVSTQIDIAAPPEVVRAVFLDFPRWKDWHKSEILFPSTLPPGTNPITLAPGDKMKVDLKNMAFHPDIVENSPSSFQWRGSIPYIFTGVHQFHFQPSETTPGGTTLVQKEDFTGLLAFMTRPGWSGAAQTARNADLLNEDLKRAAEKGAQ